jgi:hypothetical protein
MSVRFEALTGTSMNIPVFWGVEPCSLVDIDRVLEELTAYIIRALNHTDDAKRCNIPECKTSAFGVESRRMLKIRQSLQLPYSRWICWLGVFWSLI